MTGSTLWIDVLTGVLQRLHRRGDGDAPTHTVRPDFKQICTEVEAEMADRSIDISATEWQATKDIMRSIYKKTRAAEKNGYDFYQYALTPHVDDVRRRTCLWSPDVHRAVEVWCGALGWQRATIVNWTSVLAAVQQASTARFPYVSYEYAIRLEGLARPERSHPTPLIRPFQPRR